MSTTDRAAFEQYAQSQGCNDFEYDQDDSQRYRNPFTQREYKYWRAALDWQAATEAAKATGTAGEQCTCPSGDGSLRWPCPQHPPLPVAITDKTGPNGIKWYVEPNLPDGVNLYIKESK